jgi:DNA polymerase-3 subunit delta
LKVKADNYLQFLKKNHNKYNIIFLYGYNDGLVNLLYRDTIKILGVDENNPFLVSKIGANELKENPSILNDNLSTISMFAEKRFILLNLLYFTFSKPIEKIIIDNLHHPQNDNFILIIKAGNLSSQSSLIKLLQTSNRCILTACYEDEPNYIKNKIHKLFDKYSLVFSRDFLSTFVSKFSPNSLINERELEKLENLFLSNREITESLLLSFITNNEEISFNKIINCCLSGNPKDSLLYFNNIYEKSGLNIGIIRQFSNHLKVIEKLILLNKNGLSLKDAANKIKPPIFFKNIPTIIHQCTLWSLKKINITQKKLIQLELKCKNTTYPEKTLISQFILSTSLLANKK